ncbi:NTP/NDP exchange transporter [Rufibacter tibetensis]|uniref:ADP,ATP carrier protein n=1 Tax=Rufibacter tibetensis TaxID=512763 RepID=A0A0P0C4A7_9BACT|nr:MFS transporter [Rufibacter tibetensis]ALI99655.1 hypothetical protein DC20_12575 [Rufibacter tibetensis]
MNSRINLLLNIKTAESRVVKQLFLVQFCLGIATSTLFTGTLAMFLDAFELKDFPKVYIVSAVLMLITNLFYGKLETRLSPKKLLQTVILFSAISIFLSWAGLTLVPAKWLPFFLAAWNMVVYMLIGYAFWGLAAIIFNVRESKRLFFVVGAGDIPAKMFGYTAASVLAPVLGVESLLWVTIGSFLLAFFFLRNFEHQAISDLGHAVHHEHVPEKTFIAKHFHNHLIFSIAVFSVIVFTVYSLVDYTFLSEVKSRYYTSPEIAAFLGMFFAVGRVLAIMVKLMLSSRVISRLGLTNSLLLAPVILLTISIIMLLPFENQTNIFIMFGVMVLLSEVLKSAVQEPAFLVLFQPLDPHSRLKGHLISKGYTMPIALMISGVFLTGYNYLYGNISITLVTQILVGLLIAWIGSIFLIKKEYLRSLVNALKKGYFTGSELFLNDVSVKILLMDKLNSKNPQEVILALELLERAGDQNLEKRLLPLLQSPSGLVQKYVISRIVALKLTNAFSTIEQAMQENSNASTKPALTTAYYFLTPQPPELLLTEDLEIKKAALIGLSLRGEEEAHQRVRHHLEALSTSEKEEERLAVLDIFAKALHTDFKPFIETLLQDTSEKVYKKALETAGKTKDASLLPQILHVGQSRKTPYALQNAVVLFGDEAFAPLNLTEKPESKDLELVLIRAAGKVKGDFSTQFLTQLLKTEHQYQDEVIEALWNKNAKLFKETKTAVLSWLKTKMVHSRRKALYCHTLAKKPEAPLLAESLASELRQDIKSIMKSLALVYDRQSINRVMDLLSIGSPEKIANAIEMLEQVIPKRCFLVVEALIDFHLEKEKRWQSPKDKKKLSTSQIIHEIVTDNPAGCSPWVKSVACYCIISLPEPELAEAITPEPTTSDTLYTETREFVISHLSQLTTLKHAANRESVDLKFI